MGCRQQRRSLTVTIFGQRHVRPDWYVDFDGDRFTVFFEQLKTEMGRLGFKLLRRDSTDMVIHVKSYADLLNCVRLSLDELPGIHCVGHIIGKSEHCDICEDIEAAVKRLAFAPETVAPASEFQRVCHNCGCGC